MGTLARDCPVKPQPAGASRALGLWRDLAFEDVVCIGLLAAVLFVMGLGVFFRYVLNDSLTWTEEISRYGLVYITYIGCAVGVRRRSHIRIDLIERLIPSQARTVLTCLVDLLSLVFFAYMTVKTVQIMGILHNTRSAAAGIPMSYIYLAILAGFVLSIVRLAGKYLPSPARDR